MKYSAVSAYWDIRKIAKAAPRIKNTTNTFRTISIPPKHPIFERNRGLLESPGKKRGEFTTHPGTVVRNYSAATVAPALEPCRQSRALSKADRTSAFPRAPRTAPELALRSW